MNRLLSPKDIEQLAYDVAVKAAIKAGKHVLKYWPNPINPNFDKDLNLQVTDKPQGIGNYVTIADKEAEQIIIKAIQADPQLKNHRIVSEESDEITGESEYQWVIDPIDGTIAFANGLPEFGVAIGLLKRQSPIMGVIAMPALEQFIVARSGYGAQLISFDGKNLKKLISQNIRKQPLSKTLVAFDLGWEGRKSQLRAFTLKLADKVGYMPCYASVSTSNFRLAQGLVGAFLHQFPTKMDIAAAACIIAEIGGIVTDMKGNPIDWSGDSRSYLAAIDPQIHQEILQIITV